MQGRKYMTRNQREKEKVILSKFQELLRSGSDYSVEYMCEEAGKLAFVTAQSVRHMVNKYYKDLITDRMVEFYEKSEEKVSDQINKFSNEFGVCIREARLIRRYAMWRIKKGTRDE